MTTDPLPGYEWPPLPVLDPDLAAQILAERLGAAYDDLQAELERVLADPRTLHRRALVEAWIQEFQQAILDFQNAAAAEVQRFLDLHLVHRYAEGAETALGGQPMSWTQAHESAVTSLALDTYDDFLQRSHEAGRASEAMVRVVREAARTELPKAATGARTAQQAADRLEEKILAAGLDHVVYRDGTQVPVRTYARMAARTKSAVAFNAGTLNELHAEGVLYVEVFDGRECGWRFHSDKDKASQSIRTIQEAAKYPIAHPNCRRAFGGRPDVTTDDEAATAEPFGKDLDDGPPDDLAPTPAVRTRAKTEERRRRQEKRQQRRTGLSTDPEAVRDTIAALGLSPEDVAGQFADQLIQRAEDHEPEITPFVSRVVEDAGGRMAGLEFRVKGRDSLVLKLLKEAVEDDDGDLLAVAMAISDVLRFTGQFAPDDYTAGSEAALAAIVAAGYAIRVKNTWGSATNPYRAVNVAITAPDGYVWELQFHTPTSFEVKEAHLHPLYEQRKTVTDPEERQRLFDQMWEWSATIPEPDGAQDIAGDTDR